MTVVRLNADEMLLKVSIEALLCAVNFNTAKVEEEARSQLLLPENRELRNDQK